MNGDPQLSKDRFEQLPGQLSGKWPSAEASNVWFETVRRPFHFFRHFAIPTKGKKDTKYKMWLVYNKLKLLDSSKETSRSEFSKGTNVFQWDGQRTVSNQTFDASAEGHLPDSRPGNGSNQYTTEKR